MVEPPAGSSRFSAAGPALGYLAQIDYALLAALERMDDEDDFTVSIETLDDIVFHHADTDDATEKWQSKHTIDETRSLSDSSVDLWKTLGNWIAEPGDARARLVLMAVATAGDAAALLRGGAERDVAASQQRLERVARESTNAASATYRIAFLALSPAQRTALLQRVEVIDHAATAADIQPALERAVRKSVKAQRRSALVDRLRGWWHKRAIALLDAVARGEADRIGAAELEAELGELGRLARTGLTGDDDDLMVADGGQQVLPPRADGQLGRIGDGRDGGPPARDPCLSALDLGEQLPVVLLAARTPQPPAQAVLVAGGQPGEALLHDPALSSRSAPPAAAVARDRPGCPAAAARPRRRGRGARRS